jgi:hypothetical protein
MIMPKGVLSKELLKELPNHLEKKKNSKKVNLLHIKTRF